MAAAWLAPPALHMFRDIIKVCSQRPSGVRSNLTENSKFWRPRIDGDHCLGNIVEDAAGYHTNAALAVRRVVETLAHTSNANDALSNAAAPRLDHLCVRLLRKWIPANLRQLYHMLVHAGPCTATYAGPSSRKLRAASHEPISTHFSKLSPLTTPAKKPPANASPAPVVSLISLESIGCTLKICTSSLPCVATIVGSVPWVITATRFRLAFFFGRLAKCLAIAGMS